VAVPVGLLCFGVLAFAVLHATSYNAQRQPATTQQQLKKQLAQKQQLTTKTSTTGTSVNPQVGSTATNSASQNPELTSSPDTGSAPVAPTTKTQTNLINTGPGNLMLLFAPVTAISYGLYLGILKQRLCRQSSTIVKSTS
jgi:hypothetical protein